MGLGQEKETDEVYPGRLKKIQEGAEPQRLRNKGVSRCRKYSVASNATDPFKSDKRMGSAISTTACNIKEVTGGLITERPLVSGMCGRMSEKQTS